MAAERKKRLSRREVVAGTAVFVAGSLAGCVTVRPRRTRQRATDVRVADLSYRFDDYVYRAPVKFAGAIMDRATVITVECTVKTAGGKSARGVGVMPFNHIFSYPSKRMSHEEKNEVMKALAARIARATQAYPIAGHPLEINAE